MKAKIKITKFLNFFIPTENLKKSKEKWNKLAKKNAKYYVLTDYGEDITEKKFREIGERDYLNLLGKDSFLKEKIGNLNEKTVVEIGSGLGRITEFLAENFRKVIGVDISEEMIAKAKLRLQDKSNINFFTTDGNSLPVDNNKVDLVFSFIVFQHMPNLKVIKNNLKEIARVLKDRGMAKIQFRGGPSLSKKNWFYGPSLGLEEVEELIFGLGLKIVKHEGVGQKYFWVWFQKNMKILIVNDRFPPESLGGSQMVAFEEACGFTKKGYEVVVLTAVSEKKMTGESVKDGFKIVRFYSNYSDKWVPYFGIHNPRMVKKFKKVMLETKPDVVHFHNIHRNFSYRSLAVAKKFGAKVFLTTHDVMSFSYGKLTGLFEGEKKLCPINFNYKISIWSQIKKVRMRYNPFRNFIIRHYLKYPDKIFAVSFALKNALSQNRIKNIEVIHNGLDVESWQVDDNILLDFKNKYNLNSKKVVLFGGRLSMAKGGAQIIEAMSLVLKNNSEVVLLVVGGIDNFGNTMLKLAKDKGISENIIFTGWLRDEELRSAYLSSDLVVVPSICFDSFPNTNLEAMACKKPLISTCLGGSREIVEDEKNGFIINPLNEELFAKKIIYLLENNDVARQMGNNGFDKVKEKFSLEKQLGKLLEFFN